MGVFALDQWFPGIVPEVFFALLVIPVHRADDVRVAACRCCKPHVRNGPAARGRKPSPSRSRRRNWAPSPASLPSDQTMTDGWLMFAAHVCGCCVSRCAWAKAGFLGQRRFVITHAVRLEVGLGHQIEPVAVAERVPAGVVRVVARAHGVEIVLLEDAESSSIRSSETTYPPSGVHLVAVRSLDEHRLSVHQQLSALDLYLAEARVQGNGLDRLAGRVLSGSL